MDAREERRFIIKVIFFLQSFRSLFPFTVTLNGIRGIEVEPLIKNLELKL